MTEKQHKKGKSTQLKDHDEQAIKNEVDFGITEYFQLEYKTRVTS